MNAYLPTDVGGVLLTLAAYALVLIVGYVLTHVRSVWVARSISWFMVLGSVGAMERVTISEPPGFRMLALIGMLLYTMKSVVSIEMGVAGNKRLRFWQWIGFAALWVGMRPGLFEKLPRPPRPRAVAYLKRGLLSLGVGLCFLLAARGFSVPSNPRNVGPRLILSTLVLLPGLSLILHFGVFNLLVACWRSRGVECDSPFRAPWRAKSLTEFWGKRWNLAFSEMTTLAVFRPLRGLWGNAPALVAAFLFSGILHELAISVPVRAGFGGPALYFVLQGLGILLERHWLLVATVIPAAPLVSRLWTFCWIVIPLPILFHRPFLEGCIWPLVGIAP